MKLKTMPHLLADLPSPKRRLANGEKLTGCWIAIFDSIAAEMTAAGGYDVAMIDLEHGPGDFRAAIPMMQAVECRGVQPLIRSPSADAADIKRVLDLGPRGIMIPGVRDAAHAAEVVRHCRYGPAGDRGAAPGYVRATDYGRDGTGARQGGDYFDSMANDFLLIVQVELASAVVEVDQIASIDGVDMVFMGPADLSASLGELAGFERPEFVHAMERIEQAANSAGKHLGNIPFGPWSAEQLYARGYGLILGGADTMLLTAAAKADAAALRAATR